MRNRLVVALLFAGAAQAAPRVFAPDVAPFVSVSAPVVALRHVTVIDGTGAAARPDQTVIVRDGRLAAIGPAATAEVPEGAEVHDLAGHTVLPGLVGMHDHLYYSASNSIQRGAGRILEPGILLAEIAFTAPRLSSRPESPRCAPPAASSPTPT